MNEWVDGQCRHANMQPGTVGKGKVALQSGTVAYDALEAIVNDGKLLKQIPLCVHFL